MEREPERFITGPPSRVHARRLQKNVNERGAERVKRTLAQISERRAS